jgi:hypothetical protein
VKGTVTAVHPAPTNGAQMVAVVQLEGEAKPREVLYWPELIQQWGPAQLRAFLVHSASQAAETEATARDRAAAGLAAHADLVGEADAADWVEQAPGDGASVAGDGRPG